MKHLITQNADRRKLLGVIGVGSVSAAAMPSTWTKPLIDAVVLPAHAQTSEIEMCMSNTSVGGPLIGNASGADNCQAACEAEATSQNAELCDVTESTDASGATQCRCDLET